MKKFAVAFLVVLMLLLLAGSAGSCRSIKNHQSTEITKKDSSYSRVGEELYREEITIPGDSLEYVFQLQVDEEGKIKPAVVKTGSGRISFSAKIDSLNNIKIRFDCQEYKTQVQRYKTLANSYKVLAEGKNYNSLKTVIQYRTPFWNLLIIGALSVIVIILLIDRFFPKFFKLIFR